MIRMGLIVLLAVIASGCVTSTDLGKEAAKTNGSSANSGNTGTTALSDAEADGLIFMREEEKLARDVYEVLDGLYGPPIFTNIAESEQRHMDAILNLLTKYGLPDPAAGNDRGVFTNAELQALYDELIEVGSLSLADALSVGVLIEETDIADLEAELELVTHNDIQQVYENLLSGSNSHLLAFETQLAALNTSKTSNLTAAASGNANPDPNMTGDQCGVQIRQQLCDGSGVQTQAAYAGENANRDPNMTCLQTGDQIQQQLRDGCCTDTAE